MCNELAVVVVSGVVTHLFILRLKRLARAENLSVQNQPTAFATRLGLGRKPKNSSCQPLLPSNPSSL
jgi:hypothetical protein